MAEFTAARNNALPYPVYGLPFVVGFPLLDADGDPVSPSSPDSEVSKNFDTFADCTNEAVEIATGSGTCYLSLTGTELTCDVAMVRVQSTGAKTTILSLYPRKLVTIRTGTSASAGAATSTLVLDAAASAVDDFYNGMIVAAVIDGTTEVRMITDYVGATQTATVTPDWNTAPDNNDTFTVYLPDGVQIQQANPTAWDGTDITTGVPLAPTTAGRTLDVSATGEAGVDWGNVGGQTTTVGLTNTTVGTVTTTATATNVTTVNGLAANVITAAATAADFGTEVATAVWASGTRTLTSLAGLTVDTVTTLTNLPTIPANWLTAAGTAADFGTEVGAAVLSALGTGSALTSLAPAATALSTATWTSARAGYLDNVNNATLAGASFPTDPADQSLVIAATDALATLIGDVPTNAELATALAAADDAVLAAIAALSIPTANQNADALLDRAAGVETNRTLRQALRLILAAVAGKVSGAATTTTTIRDTNDSVDRIVATVDADGNRSAVTLNAG